MVTLGQKEGKQLVFVFPIFFTSTVHLFSTLFMSDGKLTEKQTSILFHLFSNCGSRLNIWEYLTRYPWELRFTSYLYVNSNWNYHQKVVFLLPVWGFPCGSAGKESVCNAGDLGSIPGLGRSSGEGKGYPDQYSGLENSMYSPWGCKESDTTSSLKERRTSENEETLIFQFPHFWAEEDTSWALLTQLAVTEKAG